MGIRAAGKRVRLVKKKEVKPPKDPCAACHRETGRFERVQCEHQGVGGKYMCFGCAKRWYRDKFVHGEYMRCFDDRCTKIVCFRELFTEAEREHRKKKMALHGAGAISEEMRFLHEAGAFQMCPRCNIPVEHDGGCPVMTCPRCSVYFDYHTGVAFP